MTDLDATRLSNAKGLYLEGIRDGRPREAQAKYSGARYRQHWTGVPDGKEGFIEFFDDFLARNPSRDIQVIRGWVDGPLVFLHVYQSLNDGAAQWVTADFFDTDDAGKLIEHWDVIQAYVEKTASGRSMVDGPSEVRDLEDTEANKAIVRNFVADVLQGGQADKGADYVATNEYAQHNPTTEYVKVHHLIGQGNFVVLYSHVRISGDDHAVFDIFRLQDGKIVEHWDVQEKIGPRDTWNNSGKF